MARQWLPLITLSIFVLLAAGARAELAYVNSNKAPLFSAKSFSSDTIVVLLKGAEVNVLTRESRWLEVESNGQRGWVSVLLLKATPPGDTVSVIGSDQVELEGNARMRASAVATAGATRGLVESNDTNAMSFDFAELQQVENFTISVQEINQFGVLVNEGE